MCYTFLKTEVRAKEVGFEKCGFVVTSRILRRPDESIINIADELPTEHVDTSCFFLLPHLDFNIEKAVANVRAVNSHAAIMQISAKTGEGMVEWREWLRHHITAVHEAEFV